MDLAEIDLENLPETFLEVLKVDYNCSLADVCCDQYHFCGYEFLDVQTGL